MENVIRLGGRYFAGVSQDVTAAQEEYLSGQLRRCGALEVLSDPAIPSNQRADEMLTRIQLAGATFQILAGCLVEAVNPDTTPPAGTIFRNKWKRVEADRNAAFFSELCDAESKSAVRENIVGLVLGFLELAAKSSTTSRKSSGPGSEESPTSTAAPQTSENSTESSAPSPATTPAASAA